MPLVSRCPAGPDWPALRADRRPASDGPELGEVTVRLRHATAPGGGDLPSFKLEACSAQRNLDEAGREQAPRVLSLGSAKG